MPENNVPENNATAPEVAWGDFPYDQPGSFTLNMKSEHTKEDRVKFVEVSHVDVSIRLSLTEG